MAERRRNIVDLHIHTSASSGGIGLPPSAVSFFRRNRYRAVSLTEEASLESLEAARKAAGELGIEYIAGIEIPVQADYPPPGQSTAHLLGYFVEPGQKLSALCERIRESSEDAMEELLARLFAAGVADISEEDLREEMLRRCGEYDTWKRPLSSAIVTGVLVRRGVMPADGARGIDDLMAKYCPELLNSWLPSVDEARDALRDAGATIILAHPLGRAATDDSAGESRQRLKRWLEEWVDGVEVYYPGYGQSQRRMLLDILQSMGRPYTGGSDTRDFSRPDGLRFSDAPYACVESLKEYRTHGRVTRFVSRKTEDRL